MSSGKTTDWEERRLHFVAIGGAGMSGLALLARGLGADVSGSDIAESSYTERVREAGIEPLIGHDADAVPPDAEVVVSTAIPEENPELEIARERGQRLLHRSELLAELAADKRVIAISGTHGKTTTASMLTVLLRTIGAEPGFALGGDLPGAGPDGGPANAGWGAGEWMVVEADESDGSFLNLSPEIAVVTNVELDHHARWASRIELLDAFGRFVESATRAAIGPDRELDELATGGLERFLRFGFSATTEGDLPRAPEPDLAAGEVERLPDGRRAFSLLLNGESRARVELAIPGDHNVLNALAALSAVELAGLDLEAAAAAASEFGGAARRLELKGTRAGARVYDDYAHHPTEVQVTLEAARELGGRRLIAVFQPHLHSRTKLLARRFGAALTLADEIAVIDVYAARVEPLGDLANVSGRLVAEAAADAGGGRPVWWLGDIETAARALGERIGEGDVVVCMGAGDIFRLAEALVAEAK